MYSKDFTLNMLKVGTCYRDYQSYRKFNPYDIDKKLQWWVQSMEQCHISVQMTQNVQFFHLKRMPSLSFGQGKMPDWWYTDIGSKSEQGQSWYLFGFSGFSMKPMQFWYKNNERVMITTFERLTHCAIKLGNINFSCIIRSRYCTRIIINGRFH